MNQGVTMVSKLWSANGGSVPSARKKWNTSGPSGPEGAESVQARLTGSTSGALTLVSVRLMATPRITASAMASRKGSMSTTAVSVAPQ